MKRAVIYCRISKDSQQTGAGVARQEADCRALCQRNGWDVVQVFSDNDVSANGRRVRPEYQKALALIESGRADVWVSWAYDRTMRKIGDLDPFIEALTNGGATAHFVQAGGIDLATQGGQMVAGMLVLVARAETGMKSERQKVANRQRAEAGKRSRTGHRPFGWADDRVTVHPVEGPAIARAIREVIAGRSLSSVATEWNTDPDLHTTTGRLWSNRTVSMLMHRPSNPGLAIYQGRILRDTAAEWQPVVTLAEHEAVCAVLDSPSRRTTPGPQRKHLLTGVARCGECGSFLYHRIVGSHGQKAHRHVLACKGSRSHGNRSAAPIEEAVEREVLWRLTRPDAAELFTAKPRKATKSATADIERIRALMDRTTQDYAEGLINGEQLRSATSVQQERLLLAQSRLAQETVLAVPERMRRISPDSVGKVWGELSLSDRQSVINALMAVTVYPTSDPRYGALPFGCLIEWKQ